MRVTKWISWNNVYDAAAKRHIDAKEGRKGEVREDTNHVKSVTPNIYRIFGYSVNGRIDTRCKSNTYANDISFRSRVSAQTPSRLSLSDTWRWAISRVGHPRPWVPGRAPAPARWTPPREISCSTDCRWYSASGIDLYIHGNVLRHLCRMFRIIFFFFKKKVG